MQCCLLLMGEKSGSFIGTAIGLKIGLRRGQTSQEDEGNIKRHSRNHAKLYKHYKIYIILGLVIIVGLV